MGFEIYYSHEILPTYIMRKNPYNIIIKNWGIIAEFRDPYSLVHIPWTSIHGFVYSKDILLKINHLRVEVEGGIISDIREFSILKDACYTYKNFDPEKDDIRVYRMDTMEEVWSHPNSDGEEE